MGGTAVVAARSVLTPLRAAVDARLLRLKSGDTVLAALAAEVEAALPSAEQAEAQSSAHAGARPWRVGPAVRRAAGRMALSGSADASVRCGRKPGSESTPLRRLVRARARVLVLLRAIALTAACRCAAAKRAQLQEEKEARDGALEEAVSGCVAGPAARGPSCAACRAADEA